MKDLEWQMILFVSTSLVHDYWIYFGLPRIYYWDVKYKSLKQSNDDDIQS